MTGLLDGHIALITGGGSGIGRGIALAFAEHGATIIAADINLAGAAETVAMIGGNAARAEALDVTDRAACNALAAKVKAEVGNLSILVNNAGIVRRATLDTENALNDWDDTIGINVNGVFNSTYAFLDQLKVTKGRIISIGSIQSFVHTQNCVAYTTSKHAVKGFCRFALGLRLKGAAAVGSTMTTTMTTTTMNNCDAHCCKSCTST